MSDSTLTAVIDVFVDVTGIDPYPEHLNLFRAGGTSLDAVRITQRLRERLGVEVSVTDVLQGPVPQEVAHQLRASRGATDHDASLPIDAAHRHEPTRAADPRSWILPTPQRRIWLLHQREPERRDHTVVASLRLIGEVDLERFARAWATVLDSHETLRMRVVEDDEIRGLADGAREALQTLDVTALPDDLGPAVVEAAVAALRQQPFDLPNGPLARGLVVRHADGTATLDLALSHLVCDGWGLSILLDDLVERALGKGAPPVVPAAVYADFAAWEQEARTRWPALAREAADQLEPVPPPLVLTSQPDGDGAAEVSLAKPPSWRDRLLDVSATHNVSPLALAMVAVAVVTARRHLIEKFVVAVPLANRPEARFEHVVGDFVNTSLVSVDLTGAQEITDVLAQIRPQIERAIRDQDLPVEMLVEELLRRGVPQESLRPAIALTIQNVPQQSRNVHGVRIEPVEIAERASKYPLVVTLDTVDLSSALMVTTDASVLGREAAAALLGQLDSALELTLGELGGEGVA